MVYKVVIKVYSSYFEKYKILNIFVYHIISCVLFYVLNTPHFYNGKISQNKDMVSTF